MKMNDFVCSCLGMDGGVLDRLCDDFDIDFDEWDVYECLEHRDRDGLLGVGRYFLSQVLDKIIENYPDLCPEKFSWDFSSTSYPDFYYDGRRFSTKKELDDILAEIDPTNSGD